VRNIETYANQVDLLVAVDNTSVASAELVSVLAAMGVEYVPLGENRRFAVALKDGCRRLSDAGCVWALTIDQDSAAPSDLVASLLDCLGTTTVPMLNRLSNGTFGNQLNLFD
jgi:GT2 family glycosyltransferase